VCVKIANQGFTVCGAGGSACGPCVNDQHCAAMSDGSGGQCKCDIATCPAGCCSGSNGVCKVPSTSFCGKQGDACVDCTQTTDPVCNSGNDGGTPPSCKY
jgi:hypothetical protein